MASKWLEWQRQRWKGNALDYVIEDAGSGPVFYCVHGICESITEHDQRKALEIELGKIWQQVQLSK